MIISRNTLPPLATLLPFEAAARLGSITDAAQELNLTQAAVSKQIKSLETWLGTPLFERRNRAVHLTEGGRQLQQVIRSALGDIALACSTLRQSSAESEIVFRSQQCEAIYWLMPRLSGFYQGHPGIDMRVSVSTTPLPEARDRFDLALQSIERDHGQAKLLHHAKDEVFPVCSPDCVPTGPGSLSLTDLLEARLLHHDTARQDWITWDKWLSNQGIEKHNARDDLSFDSYPMVMQAAIEGHGIALGWWRNCEHLLDTGALIRPCDAALTISDGLGIYAPSSAPLRDGAQALLDWLIAELA